MRKSLIINMLHVLPAEMAHLVALRALACGLAPAQKVVASERLATEIAGLRLPNPVGLAAGFDKNGDTLGQLAAQGFGFGECGTVTPQPQPGNPKPRLFRLKDEECVVNRFGFNNKGLDYMAAKLQARPQGFIVGANIGKNAASTDAVADYVTGMQRCYPLADYLTVNISSPNTKGLRDLQGEDAFRTLAQAVTDERRRLSEAGEAYKPVFIKLAPDLEADAIRGLCDITLALGIDGLILTNTTLSRPVPFDGAGGMSGRALKPLALEALRVAYRHTGGALPLIGAGGISSPEDAYERIRAGASAIQLYSALVFQGMQLVTDIRLGLCDALRRDGFANVAAAVGTES
jgi:dihydroorotate dehydrogenase